MPTINQFRLIFDQEEHLPAPNPAINKAHETRKVWHRLAKSITYMCYRLRIHRNIAKCPQRNSAIALSTWAQQFGNSLVSLADDSPPIKLVSPVSLRLVIATDSRTIWIGFAGTMLEYRGFLPPTGDWGNLPSVHPRATSRGESLPWANAD